jgi:hypothetical protein
MSAICIAGKSGEGKSTSIGKIPELNIEGLDPKNTVILNVTGKPLPFRGWAKNYTPLTADGGNYLNVSDSAAIAKTITHISKNRLDITNIVIDDFQFVLSFEYMNKAKENGYNKFVDLGVNFRNIINAAINCRADLKVYFLWHPEEDRDLGLQLKTVGSMINQYLTPEGLFTVILYTRVVKEGGKMTYSFVTNNDGKYPAKSPIGMFSDLYIPNDLGVVSKAIDTYYSGE